MPMPGRSLSLSNYRFGFNGKENDDEVKGFGNQQDYGLRIYDSRLGKFLSVDPLFKDYAFYSTYQFAGNNPIEFIDMDGGEPKAPFMISPPGSAIIFANTATSIVTSVAQGTIAFAFAIPNMMSAMHAAGNTKSQEIKNKFENEAKNELANFAIGYMTGAAFNGLIKGVGKILGNEVSATATTSKSIYRGDARSPTEVFNTGFEAKGRNTSIPDYVEANEPSIFIGTSKSASEAAKKSPSGYVYDIENNGKGLDVNNYYKAMEGKQNPHLGEQEVIFDKLIPSAQIRGAFPVIDGKVDTKKFIPNPSYKPSVTKK